MYYKEYPAHLVFEILNEPAFGSQIKNDDELPEWYNAVIPVIRQSNPKRILLAGGPNHNDIDRGVKYLTPEYLTLPSSRWKRLRGGWKHLRGFSSLQTVRADDAEGEACPAAGVSQLAAGGLPGHGPLGGLVGPGQETGRHHGMGSLHLQHGRGEWITYTRYFHDQLKQRGIGSMYYTAFFANDWAWSIFDSEYGWDQAALDILTGVKSPAIPPTNPLVNSEFNAFSHRWTATSISQEDAVIKGHNDSSLPRRRTRSSSPSRSRSQERRFERSECLED